MSKKEDDTTISIPSDNKTETIRFNVANLLFIKSDGSVYLKENNLVNKLFHRASFQTMEKKLSNYPHVLRVHRSYLINCMNIEYSQGTARNYQLFFSAIDHNVPVARNKIQFFNEAIQNLTPVHHK